MKLRVYTLALVFFISHAGAENIYRFKLPKDIYSDGLPRSCSALLAEDPSRKSGEVTIFPQGLYGPPIEVFCDMTTDGGGWTRILSLGVGKKSCFGQFSLNAEGYCVKNTKSLSFNVSTIGIPFAEMRGGVSAYQSGSNDGFRRYGSTTSEIDDYYVDGISFTYLNELHKRQHIFTYVIGQSNDGSRQSCPSSGGDAAPSFVGANYHCETGNKDTGYTFDFYPTVIFSGYEFIIDFGSKSSRDLEVRVMNDQDINDENIALNGIYIFIR